MKKLNKKSLIIAIIIIFIIIGRYYRANRYDILLNYNEKDYEHTQFVVNVKGNKSLSGYYLVDEKYYKYNKDKSKEWIEEDIKVKNLGNQYCEPRIELLKSIKNLDETSKTLTDTKPDITMLFRIQKDKVFYKESYDYYDGIISIYLKDNVLSIDKFGIENDRFFVLQKEKYYTIDSIVKENANKIIEQVLAENN